mmetsp:Transcript_4667/g.9851  ORF Transcript_4667/g.9851 Transcript_4667/m.9851 type:complete len:442 (+) Transcript_4667:69-1394(+)|eukprot:CAMPEP_0194323072 /NCGR_PEP_ID=MMETSP0171-20130528/23814_1 /TAXON_ID=218684 /ORGANISM="Corethron pennatum, Strain L29A3" /LENGTH=441 /DNA_ID=CAMNT_0039081569 /DNA_START=69 /DNA_END=1394 /DNA_ORIENTATION=+
MDEEYGQSPQLVGSKKKKAIIAIVGAIVLGAIIAVIVVVTSPKDVGVAISKGASLGAGTEDGAGTGGITMEPEPIKLTTAPTATVIAETAEQIDSTPIAEQIPSTTTNEEINSSPTEDLIYPLLFDKLNDFVDFNNVNIEDTIEYTAYRDLLNNLPEDLSSDTRGMKSVDMVQRFILTLAYYQLGGADWTTISPTSAVHECYWEFVDCYPDDNYDVQQVYKFDIQDQEAKGMIPKVLAALPNLEYIRLDNNTITGTIPDEFGSMPFILNLDFSNNDLTGFLPESLFSATSLESLDVGGNQISGTISNSISNLINLELFDISSNKIEGSLPERIYDIVGMEVLDLGNNQLTGTISSNIKNWIYATHFLTASNKMGETLPVEMGELLMLETLDLHDNDFTGTVPNEICALTTENLKQFQSDCGNSTNGVVKIVCSCCTACATY